MRTRTASGETRLLATCTLLALCTAPHLDCAAVGDAVPAKEEKALCEAGAWRVRLVDAARVNEELLADSKAQGFTGIALELSSPRTKKDLLVAQPLVKKAMLDLFAWVSVGRDEEAAAAHPEWLHVPQHDNWLERPPGRERLEGRAGKHGVYPWVCVNNRQVFAHEKERLARLLTGVVGLEGVFLADLQGPPAGCGCGNTLCRSWDNSPGEKVAQSPYEKPALFFPLAFLEEARKTLPGERLIPVLCPECEFGTTLAGVKDPDGQTGACRGIECHTCGEHYYPRLAAAAAGEPALGLLCLYKEFERDLPLYGARPAAWVGENVKRLRAHNEKSALIAVVQGWNVSAAEVARQMEEAMAAGARGVVLAERKIDQSWSAKAIPGK